MFSHRYTILSVVTISLISIVGITFADNGVFGTLLETGKINGTKITDNSISNFELAPSSVDNSKIKDGAIGANQVDTTIQKRILSCGATQVMKGIQPDGTPDCRSKTLSTENGACGNTVNGGPFSSAPTTELCATSGGNSPVTQVGTLWTWTCNGGGDPLGNSISCNVAYADAPVCGTTMDTCAIGDYTNTNFGDFDSYGTCSVGSNSVDCSWHYTPPCSAPKTMCNGSCLNTTCNTGYKWDSTSCKCQPISCADIACPPPQVKDPNTCLCTIAPPSSSCDCSVSAGYTDGGSCNGDGLTPCWSDWDCDESKTGNYCTSFACTTQTYSAWSTCSKTCDTGVQTRTDNCGNIYTQNCNTQSCNGPINCTYENVVVSGSCYYDNNSCQDICEPSICTYNITAPAKNGGSCPVTQGQTCATPTTCAYITQNFGTCSGTCGNSQQSFTYHITAPATNGGSCPVTEGQMGYQSCDLPASAGCGSWSPDSSQECWVNCSYGFDCSNTADPSGQCTKGTTYTQPGGLPTYPAKDTGCTYWYCQ